MGRRREESFIDEVVELLKITPTWVGPVLAIAVFGVLRLVAFLIPAKAGTADVSGQLLPPILTMFSWILAGAVLLAWVMAEVSKFFNRRLLDGQTGIQTIRDLSWQEFERLVAEAYRRKGFMAEVIGSAAGDGGVDIRLTGPGQTILVQCKQWKAYTVGVTTVRELLGVVVSQRATMGIVVTSGRFTREAKNFAHQNPQIELVDGPQLADLVRNVQPGQQHDVPMPSLPAVSQPACPQCGSMMILRTARKGRNAGSQFWGCSKYPTCRGTQEYRMVMTAAR